MKFLNIIIIIINIIINYFEKDIYTTVIYFCHNFFKLFYFNFL